MLFFFFMFYRGRVRDGVIVLEDGAQLPEGSPVIVRPVSSVTATAPDDPVYQLADLAMPTGIADLATNIDYYLYGHPKVADAGE